MENFDEAWGVAICIFLLVAVAKYGPKLKEWLWYKAESAQKEEDND